MTTLLLKLAAVNVAIPTTSYITSTAYELAENTYVKVCTE